MQLEEQHALNGTQAPFELVNQGQCKHANCGQRQAQTGDGTRMQNRIRPAHAGDRALNIKAGVKRLVAT